jgi:hypothetical protein
MLLREPTTKNAARATGGTWRQEILDICPNLDVELAVGERCDRLVEKLADYRRMLRLKKMLHKAAPHQSRTGVRFNQVSFASCSTTN